MSQIGTAEWFTEDLVSSEALHDLVKLCENLTSVNKHKLTLTRENRGNKTTDGLVGLVGEEEER